MMPPTLETPRLRMRGMTADDLDALWSITGRADVMAHYVDLLDRSQGWTRDRTAGFIAGCRRSWDEVGYGRWLMTLEHSGTVVGYCGLNTLDWLPAVAPAVELSFRLHPHYWGRGLAVEAGGAALAWASDHGRDVVAATVRENVQSHRALQKLGMALWSSHWYVSTESGRSALFDVYRHGPNR